MSENPSKNNDVSLAKFMATLGSLVSQSDIVKYDAEDVLTDPEIKDFLKHAFKINSKLIKELNLPNSMLLSLSAIFAAQKIKRSLGLEFINLCRARLTYAASLHEQSVIDVIDHEKLDLACIIRDRLNCMVGDLPDLFNNINAGYRKTEAYIEASNIIVSTTAIESIFMSKRFKPVNLFLITSTKLTPANTAMLRKWMYSCNIPVLYLK